MPSTIRYVGLDVHKDTITIAVAVGKAEAEVVGTVPNAWMAFHRRLKTLGAAKELRCCYEAGPCGFEL